MNVNPFRILVYGVFFWCALLITIFAATGCKTVPTAPVNVDAAAVSAELDYENVVVVYEADWCPACRMVGELLPGKLKGREENLKIVRVDVDKANKADIPAGLEGIPYFVVYKDGVKTFEGNVEDEEQFNSLFKE